MTPEQQEQLENEKVRGTTALHSYEAYIKNFCDSKRETLFMAFSELPLSAERELMEVKRMLFAIDTLEAEILSEIKTGELAAISLNAQEGHEVH